VNQYSADSKLLKNGRVKHFVLKLAKESPTLKIDIPVHNSYVFSDEIFTRGDLFKTGSLFVNGEKVADNRKGPFDYRVNLSKDERTVVYKEVLQDGTVSYYLRNVLKRERPGMAGRGGR
jgi:hypothetical protein